MRRIVSRRLQANSPAELLRASGFDDDGRSWLSAGVNELQSCAGSKQGKMEPQNTQNTQNTRMDSGTDRLTSLAMGPWSVRILSTHSSKTPN